MDGRVGLQGHPSGGPQWATVLLFTFSTNPYFEEKVTNAHLALYFDQGPRAEARIVAKTSPGLQKSQTTQEAFT